ncbi:MAG TPA: CHRD domain-containing protein [Acetobacteraceae bacterium]|nr:CHRD domain-containing protein [Acetobacteraceae bacterium]
MLPIRVAVIAGLAAVAGTAAFGPSAFAQTPISCRAVLDGAQEVPPHAAPSTGLMIVSLNPQTRSMSFSVNYTNLSGPATAAHFHGPAAKGQNAGVQVGLQGSLASPIQSTAVLTPAQIVQLEAGQWYFNIHTQANPGGEIRGQVICTHG